MASDPPGPRAEPSSARRPWELSAAVTRNWAHGIQGGPLEELSPPLSAAAEPFLSEACFNTRFVRWIGVRTPTDVSLGARPCCVLTADHSIHPFELSVPLGQGWWATWPVLRDLDSSSAWPGAAGPRVTERVPPSLPWLHWQRPHRGTLWGSLPSQWGVRSSLDDREGLPV